MDRLSLRFLDKPRRQRGELHLPAETAIHTIGFLTLLIVGVNLVLLGQAQNGIQNAAHAAARDVSLLRSPRTAAETARDSAQHAITTAGVTCGSLEISTDASGLTAPLGQTGTVAVTVSCAIPLAPALVEWILPAVQVTRSATCPVDPYRERP